VCQTGSVVDAEVAFILQNVYIYQEQLEESVYFISVFAVVIS
jgi:hypothetical protein